MKNWSDVKLMGLQLSLLPATGLLESIELFLQIQLEFRHLEAAEVHMDLCEYQSCAKPGQNTEALAELRSRVACLGFHLPFMDLHPLSKNQAIREASMMVLQGSIEMASQARANYVVFHARSNNHDHRQSTGYEGRWSEVIQQLSAAATHAGVRFYLENADDLRLPDMVDTLIKGADIGLCLDIGHLYERYDPSSRWLKYLCRLNDKLLKRPGVCHWGIPAAQFGSWLDAFDYFNGKIECLHVHNHNGIIAHQPLRQGHINLGLLSKRRQALVGKPVIIEVDYRGLGLTAVKSDLKILEGILYG